MSKRYIATTRGCRLLPSYYECIRPLNGKIRLQLYDSVMDFVFQQTEPDPNLEPVALAVFAALRPTLERSVRHFQAQYENGCKGGRPEGAGPQDADRRTRSGEQNEPGDNPEETQDIRSQAAD